MPTQNDRGPHRPRTNIQYHVENGWAVPDQPQTPPRRTSTQEQRRAAARRARGKAPQTPSAGADRYGVRHSGRVGRHHGAAAR